ncbi:zinc finger BED domain-containing protein 4-like [Acyrthosiphon pisum]|uniref:BED-type domain-containing protein n=1 Tax=Acyrthosiphon pisum TaxID=7029 RepID=A0A8R1X0V2_ACYPI|nr:zinc finger BED domain-containing protein 4-like [Acyrthosiphon pisum]|eukprot:XP_008178823.1 PREDICTED: zinc finger BED domain-containing protein 4-like [Acyrthosiphon pisum]
MSQTTEKKRFSIVWQYMTAVDSIIAVCDTCQKKLSYKTSLTNLKKHLKAVHGINITEKVDRERESTPDVDNVVSSSGLTASTTLSSLTTITPILTFATSASTSSISTFATSASTSTLKRKQPSIASFLPRKITPDRKKMLDNALVNMIVTDFQPFKIVEDKGFKKFVNLLNPNYSLPTRQAISKTLIPLEYQKCVSRVEELIEKEVNNAIITKWKLDGKVVLVVSDNASNIKNAINNLQIRHLGSFAHTINLVVEEGLKCESDLINKVKTIVTHFRKSTKANKILEKNKINSGIKDPKKLIQAVNTRWNSVFYMLERFVLLENSVRASLGLLENPPSSLTGVEWIVVKELCTVLRPFESATKVVSGEMYMTASMILPIVNGLTEVSSKMNNKPEFDSRTHKVVNSISNAMKSKTSWGNIYLSKTLAKCTFLDPRFKNILFSSNPSFTENIKTEITDEVTHIIQNIRSKNTDNTLTPHNNVQEPFVENQGNEFSIWGSLDVHVSQSRPINTNRSRAILEVQNYLDEALVPVRDHNLL